MNDQPLTKKQLKDLRKLQNLQRESSQQRQGMTKWIVIAAVTMLFLGFFGFLIYSAKQTSSQIKLSNSGWVRGNPKAPNTLIEFGDIQCPACKAAEPFVQQLLKDENGKLKLLFKYFPLTSVHIHAMEGAIALEAASRQGKFWQLHDLMFEKQDEWGSAANATPIIAGYAKSLGLNMTKFNKDIQDKSIVDKINASENEGIAAGVDATPTFYINGTQVDASAVQTYTQFKQAVEAHMK